MPSLLDLVEVLPADNGDDEEPEDILSAAAGLVFPDDLRNLHGDPGRIILYKSPRFGPLRLRTSDPAGGAELWLFAHYLWNAALLLAQLIATEGPGAEGAEQRWRRWSWGVEGERVLELGAGVGLGGIVATLAGADEHQVVISDYPINNILDNVRRNARANIPESAQSRCTIVGHTWGDVMSPFAREYAHHFTRIIAADCYWMPAEHDNLIRSMLHLLAPHPDARIFAVAGFHTGRAKLAAFFDEALAQGLVLEDLYEEDDRGCVREWVPERDGGKEHVSERKKWQVIARLKR